MQRLPNNDIYVVRGWYQHLYGVRGDQAQGDEDEGGEDEDEDENEDENKDEDEDDAGEEPAKTRGRGGKGKAAVKRKARRGSAQGKRARARRSSAGERAAKTAAAQVAPAPPALQGTRPPIVIVLRDFEAFDHQVEGGWEEAEVDCCLYPPTIHPHQQGLSDFVHICSRHCAEIPIVFIFGVASSAAALHE